MLLVWNRVPEGGAHAVVHVVGKSTRFKDTAIALVKAGRTVQEVIPKIAMVARWHDGTIDVTIS